MRGVECCSRWNGVSFFLVMWALGCARSSAATHDSPIQSEYGTLAVVTVESNQITVAIDSRSTTKKARDKESAIHDGTQKVSQLSSNVGFFVTGTSRLESRRWTNSLPDTANELADEWKSRKAPIQLERFANEFKSAAAADLVRFSAPELLFLQERASKPVSSNLFAAVFFGQDADGAFKVFCVMCSIAVDTNQTPTEVRLVYDVSEKKLGGQRTFYFFGAIEVFERAKVETKSPLGTAFRQIRSSQAMLAEPVSAALLDVGLRELGVGPDSPVGYPIFVYVVDAGGLRLTRKVEQGAGVPFDSRLQGKQ